MVAIAALRSIHDHCRTPSYFEHAQCTHEATLQAPVKAAHRQPMPRARAEELLASKAEASIALNLE